jgi:hypothetical protein
VLRRLAAAAVFLCIFFGSLELALRLVPQAVPLTILVHFQEELRQTVADARGLPTRQKARTLPRDDGGPELHIYRPGVTLHMHAPDPGQVSTIPIDDAGFCNPPESSYQRPHIDLLAIGDSFTYCTTVRPEETWVADLARESGLSTYDLGVGGVGLYEYLEILTHFGLAKSPRIVVMNVYEGNDLRDASRYQEYRTARGDAAAQAADPRTRVRRAFGSSWLGRHSYAANLLVGGALALANEIDEPDSVAKRAGIRKNSIDFRYRLDFGASSVAMNPENTDRDEVEHAMLVQRGIVSFDLFEPALERYAALALEHGFVPVVSYTPSAHTTYADFVRFEEPSLAPLLREFSEDQRGWLAQRCRTLGLRFVDLTPALRAAARSGRERELLYFPSNLHLSQAGHRVVAAALRDFLAALPR